MNGKSSGYVAVSISLLVIFAGLAYFRHQEMAQQQAPGSTANQQAISATAAPLPSPFIDSATAASGTDVTTGMPGTYGPYNCGAPCKVGMPSPDPGTAEYLSTMSASVSDQVSEYRPVVGDVFIICNASFCGTYTRTNSNNFHGLRADPQRNHPEGGSRPRIKMMRRTVVPRVTAAPPPCSDRATAPVRYCDLLPRIADTTAGAAKLSLRALAQNDWNTE